MTKNKTTKSDKARKLFRQGYSVVEVTKQVGMNYGHAYNVMRSMVFETEEPKAEVAAEPDRQELRRATQGKVVARIAANKHEVPEHQQHLIAEHYWDGVGDRVWCKHGIDQLGEMCEVCWSKTVAKPEPTGVDALLTERGSRYGNFLDTARITQRLKNVAHQFAQQHDKTFDVDQAEALDMIFNKIGRILNGDPNYADSWIDIAGYAKLVADRLEGKVR
jgi:hypothetical protein